MFSLKLHLKLTIISTTDTTDLNKLFIFCLSRSVKSTNCLPSNTTNTNAEYQNEFIEKWSDLRSDHFENVKSSSPNHTVYESLETFGKTDESSILKIQKDYSSELSAIRAPNFKLHERARLRSAWQVWINSWWQISLLIWPIRTLHCTGLYTSRVRQIHIFVMSISYEYELWALKM